jgi:hypothetical protein
VQFSDQEKEDKLYFLQHPSEINGSNLNSVRYEVKGNFMSKKQEYLRQKINELATNSRKRMLEIYTEE